MTGLDGQRVYLDWNATAPLRPEARAAMLGAMDTVGNPSSVHAEGQAAKKIVESARSDISAPIDPRGDDWTFTATATEAASQVIASGWDRVFLSSVEHDCIFTVASGGRVATEVLPVDSHGRIDLDTAEAMLSAAQGQKCLLAVQTANSETGVEQDARAIEDLADRHAMSWLADCVQSLGKSRADLGAFNADYRLFSGHKIGAPKGIGALSSRKAATRVATLVPGGGQEQGRRSGTENVIGIAGFGAAARAARHDLDVGAWDRVEKLRNILEERLESSVRDLTIFGREAPRLPNTSCFAVPGWKGETQVMQMDLSGFAVSAGSACSSGKVNKASRVLMAMGFDETTASSAIRVSIGPTTTEAEVMAFAETWIEHYNRRASRAA